MAKTASASARQAGSPENVSSGEREAMSSAEVAAWICDRIRRCRFVPGQRLIEADLMRETGATRTRVREALQRLGSEGLVLIEEFRGASVRRFSHDELSAIYRTRSVLEGLAAADFARRDAAADKAELAEAQAELDVAVEAVNHEGFARANDRWHGIIIRGGDNPYVAQFVDRLRVPISRLLLSSFHSRQRIDQANSDHQVITAAILAGDATAAERRMREHVQAGFAAIVAQGIEA